MCCLCLCCKSDLRKTTAEKIGPTNRSMLVLTLFSSRRIYHPYEQRQPAVPGDAEEEGTI